MGKLMLRIRLCNQYEFVGKESFLEEVKKVFFSKHLNFSNQAINFTKQKTNEKLHCELPPN